MGCLVTQVRNSGVILSCLSPSSPHVRSVLIFNKSESLSNLSLLPTLTATVLVQLLISYLNCFNSLLISLQS